MGRWVCEHQPLEASYGKAQHGVAGIHHRGKWNSVSELQCLDPRSQDTVILNANVAFLAIHSVDNTTDRRSAAQIASYISVVASLGSVMMALTLLRQYRTKNIRDANQVVSRLNLSFVLLRKPFILMCAFKISHFSTGTDKLAIIYSLPYVLLVCS